MASDINTCTFQGRIGKAPKSTFTPSGKYLLILNMGDGSGILCKHRWVWNGCWSFLLKDFIDRRFMRRFQVSGELTESNGMKKIDDNKDPDSKDRYG